jgi:acylphosphatase
MSELAALHVKISGRVQGVYFRAFTQRHAASLGLAGYVRNLPDRSVEVHAEGGKEALEQLLETVRKGPPGARVDSVELGWFEYTGKYHQFAVTS